VNPGTHTAGDGSFGRSVGIQGGRAVVLIGIAVVIGLLLLHHEPGSGKSVSLGGTSSKTTTFTLPAGFGGGTTTTVKSSGTTVTVPLRAPSQVKVLVANGTEVNGLAGRVAATLHTKGYQTLTPTDSVQKPSTTSIYFEPSYSSDAAALATALGLPATAVQAMPQPPPVSDLPKTTNILVLVGADLAGSTTTTT
jgi:hypothetical protein